MTDITLDRRNLLSELVPNPERYLMISGLAGASKDAAAFTDDGANLFTMAGTMGASVSMGLGVALSAPDKDVIVFAGDGELMMNVGSLATVASMMPANLSIVCIDNGCHGETGGQPGHTALRTNLALMAEGAGLPSVMTIQTQEEVAQAAAFLTEAPGPRFLWARVMTGPPSAYKRNFNLAECRQRFRDTYLRQTP